MDSHTLSSWEDILLNAPDASMSLHDLREEDIKLLLESISDATSMESNHFACQSIEETQHTEDGSSCSKMLNINAASGDVTREQAESSKTKAAVLPCDRDGDTLLHIGIAKNEENITEWIRRAPPGELGIDMINNFNQTALHLAMYLENESCVTALLLRNADASITDAYQSTPLHIACSKNSLDLARLLLQGTNVCYENGRFPGMLKPNYLNLLDGEGRAAFHMATENKNVHLMRLLYQYGADVNVQDSTCGRTSLIISLESALAGHLEYVEIAELLITEFHVDVNINTLAMYSPLHYACLMNCKRLVELLISRECNVGKKNSEHKTEKDLATEDEIKTIMEKALRKKRRNKLKSRTHEPSNSEERRKKPRKSK